MGEKEHRPGCDGGMCLCGFSFPQGPRGQHPMCCNKPVGCTMVDDGCAYLRHQWKLDCVPGHRERMNARDSDG